MKEAEELVQALRARIRRNKGITLLIGAGCFALFLVFWILREVTKEVTVRESSSAVIPDMTFVHYNEAYGFLGGLFLIISLPTLAIFVLECFLSRVDRVEVGGSEIILYRALGTALYIDGRKIEKTLYYWEAPLADRSTVTVTLSRNALFAHLQFSNGRASIDL